MRNTIGIDDPCILLDGPSSSDAAFYGRWLLAVAKVQELWETIEDEFDALHAGDIPDLGSGALHFVSSITNTAGIVTIKPTESMLELAIITEFVMMAELGLFSLNGEHYQFTEPAEKPSIEMLRSVALQLETIRATEFELAVKAQSDHSPTYPKQLSAIPRSKAVQLRQWLNEMGDPSGSRTSLVS